jgi:hypothetical protein
MTARYILSDYFDAALKHAKYRRPGDGSYVGKIARCPGLVVFSDSAEGCREEMRSTLEEWVLLGLKLGHPLPIVDGIDLNREPLLEPVDSR